MHSHRFVKYAFKIKTRLGVVVDNLMIHGSDDMGSYGRYEYAEFTKVGQPRIIGRYPIHFHMNGDASESYAIGNAVHNSFARVTTIHAVHYLTYRWVQQLYNLINFA